MTYLFEPRRVNDVFGDPGLYCDFRDERRAVLVHAASRCGITWAMRVPQARVAELHAMTGRQRSHA